jgi:hypothetical protein
MTIKTLSLITILIFGYPGFSSAQQPAAEPSSAVGDFLLNPLQRVMQSVQQSTPSKSEGLSTSAINSTRPVRNPFIPSLPKINQGEEIKPAVPTRPSIENIRPRPQDPKTKGAQTVRPNFRIQGLVWNTDRPQAIINDQVFNIGDTIDSWTITAIEKAGISVVSNNITFLIEP